MICSALLPVVAIGCAVLGGLLALLGIALVIDERRWRARLVQAFADARVQENEIVSDLRRAKPERKASGSEGSGEQGSDAQESELWLARWRLRRPIFRARALASSQARLPRTAPFLAFLAAVLFLLIAAGLAVADEALGSSEQTSGPSAVISYVDVGQGDGVVMHIGNKIIVSDAGELNPQSVDQELRRLGATRIDIAILTHPHKDHVKNFLDLLDIYKWPIKTAVLSHSAHWEATKNNRLLIQTLGAHSVRLLYVTTGDRFSWGGASWQILSPPPNRYTEDFQAANSSVVYVLRVNRLEFLFTADIGPPVAKEVANLWTSKHLGHATVFLATHHGSANGSTPDLLKAIEPKWAVLSTGPNTYKHPSPAAIARLEMAGASIWCTAANGTVTARVSTKGRLTWKASRQTQPWWSASKHRETGSCVGR